MAWLTADDTDNDPVVFLTDLALAIDRIEPLGTELFSAITSATISARAVVGRLLAAMWRHSERISIALDDGHRITSRPCLDLLAELIEHLPEGSQVAIVGRAQMRLPVARWRANGLLLEIGSADLAMDDDEATRLGRELGLHLPAELATDLTRATHGWPALLTLAIVGARISRRESDRSNVSSQDLIADYLRSEVLERHSEREVEFLTRTAILEQLSAPLCDAVLGRPGSAEVLRKLARSALLVDEYGGSYRYHAILRDFLIHELSVREPDRLVTLHRRAAAWYRANENIEAAVNHAFAAQDLDLVAALIGSGFVSLHWSGQRATIRAWARRVGSAGLEARPGLAVLAAWEEIAAGDVAATERWADIAERGIPDRTDHEGTASFEAMRAMLRAAMVRNGAHDALANATGAVELIGSDGSWRAFALWQAGIARITLGDRAGADTVLADAVVAAYSTGDVAIRYCVLGHRALVAADQGAWDLAAALIRESNAIEPTPLIDGYLSSVPSRAVRIRLLIHEGEIEAARRELARAASLRPLLTAAAPAAAVQCILALARAHLALDDPAGARALVTQARDVIALRPDLGVLPAEVDALRATLRTVRAGGAMSLTVAELRVLALMPYYLSFKEIGQRLGVKETTIKTQALAIYRKLDAGTRSAAIDLAVEAGLLERFWAETGPAPARRSPGWA